MSQTVDYRVSRAFSLYGCMKGDATEHTKVCLRGGQDESHQKKTFYITVPHSPKTPFSFFPPPKFSYEHRTGLYEPSCKLSVMLTVLL